MGERECLLLNRAVKYNGTISIAQAIQMLRQAKVLTRARKWLESNENQLRFDV